MGKITNPIEVDGTPTFASSPWMALEQTCGSNGNPISAPTTKNQTATALPKDISIPLETLEFAPALTEANVFYLGPFLSCIDAPLHRRYGERHLGDYVRVHRTRGVDAIYARDQHQQPA